MSRRPWWVGVVVAGLALIVLPRSAPDPSPAAIDPPVETVAPITLGVTTTALVGADREYRARDKTTTTFPTTTRPAPTTSTAPSTTTTRATDASEVTHPLTQHLPHETPNWQIEWTVREDRLTLTVTLLVVLNRPEQVTERRAALIAAKADVLAWLGARATPGSYSVVWRPGEAAAL